MPVASVARRGSPDGRRIVTASRDHTARVWDLQGRELMVLRGHRGAVSKAWFFPCGEYVWTESDDDTARIWSVFAARMLEKADTAAFRTFTAEERARYAELLGEADDR